MNSNYIIQARGVSKKFCRNLNRSMWYGMQDILRDTLNLCAKTGHLRPKEFWALDNISFEMRQGEFLGIIGPNGAGKSTALKLLNGIIIPDIGEISIHGSVGALIELGAGFHPMLTGRENIYINGAIFGLSRKEIDKHFNSIVEFSELKDFINTPVKHYSSGMYVRLGFSIAAHFNPDILLVDEVLAVGDARFRNRCYDWFAQRIRKKQSTIFISHSTDVIQRICSRCLVINEGNIIFDGEVDSAVDCYMNSLLLQHQKQALSTNKSELTIVSARLVDEHGNELRTLLSGEDIFVEVHYKAQRKVESPIVGTSFYNAIGVLVLAVNSQDADVRVPDLEGEGIIKVRFVRPQFTSGRYFAQVSLNRAESAALAYDFYRLPQSIHVQNSQCRRGIINVETEWIVNNKVITKDESLDSNEPMYEESKKNVEY